MTTAHCPGNITGNHSRCSECLAAQALLSFNRSSNVVDNESSYHEQTNDKQHCLPVMTDVHSPKRDARRMKWTFLNRPCSTLTPPPSDSDTGSLPSPQSAFCSDDDLDGIDLPPSLKRSKLLEVCMTLCVHFLSSFYCAFYNNNNEFDNHFYKRSEIVASACCVV